MKIPLDFERALAEADLLSFFEGCTAAHQREYLRWIEEAKRPETRANRIGRAIVMIAEKQSAEHARAK